jgi:hypothetical protein
MAATVVGICNRALQKLGATRIESLTDDSKNARACNACYEPLRDALLRVYPFKFAISRATLAADAVAPTWGRSNSFQLPSNFIALAPKYAEDNEAYSDWEVEGQKILTDDSAPLYLRYVAQVSDPNLMDPLFRELLSTKMALEMCEELTQSNTKKEGLRNDFREVLAESKRRGAVEAQPVISPTDDWITARQ